MPKTSAGLLLYRRRDALEVLLVHPGGPFWARKDAGAWSIPKGELDPDEDVLAAARREVAEETGWLGPEDPALYRDLGEVRQKAGKIVRCFAVEAELDVDAIVSNTFEIEWPPRSGRRATFPEIDRAAWLDLETARAKILEAQDAFLDRLEAALS